MKRAIAFAAALMLAGCFGDDQEPPNTTMQKVNVAVPQPCTVDTKNQRPPLLNMDQLRAALVAAENVDTRAKIVMTQLLAHMGWLPVVEDAMKGCSAAAPPTGGTAPIGSTPR